MLVRRVVAVGSPDRKRLFAFALILVGLFSLALFCFAIACVASEAEDREDGLWFVWHERERFLGRWLAEAVVIIRGAARGHDIRLCWQLRRRICVDHFEVHETVFSVGDVVQRIHLREQIRVRASNLLLVSQQRAGIQSRHSALVDIESRRALLAQMRLELDDELFIID